MIGPVLLLSDPRSLLMTTLSRLFLLTSLLLTGCAVPGDLGDGVIYSEDWRSKAAEELFASYVANDVDGVGKWLVEGVTIGFNAEEVDKATFLAAIPVRHGQFKDIKVSRIIKTLVYNDGMVFTNIWAQWQGALRETGDEVKMPVQMWMTWQDGKIQHFQHYYDPAPMNAALESIGASR